MVRLFVAAYPPVEALDDLEGAIESLHIASGARGGVNARLSARPLWHVTLAFLGEVDDHRVPSVTRALDRAAEQAHPSTLRLAGGGRFGRSRFTTIYAAVAGDVESLTRTATAIRHESRAIRVAYDEKRFRPHLTLARPGDRLTAAQVADDLAALDRYRGPQWTNDRLTLVSSHLGPSPRHESLHVAVFP